MIWSIIQQIGRQVSSYIVFLILALYLTPEDFGILGMAVAWAAFVQVLSEVGFSAALIQRKKIRSKHFSTTFYVNIGLGVILSAIGIALSWPAALFYGTPEVQPVMAALSVGLLVNSFSLTQVAIAQRDLRFRDLAIRDISASVSGGIVGIALAYMGFGVWSLVARSLMTSAVGAVLLWNLSAWRPCFSEASMGCVHELWGYSSKIFAFNIFKYFAQNSDKLLIGYLLGSEALGLYTFAQKIVLVPVAGFVGAIGAYLFPQFSRMQEDLRSIRSKYLFITKIIMGTVTPSMVIVAMLSPYIIPFLFGQKWIPTIPLVQVFAGIALMQSLISPVGQLMKALNRPGWLFNWSVVFTLITTSFIWLGSHQGNVLGAAIGLLVSHLIALPIIYSITIKLIPVNIPFLLRGLLPSVLSSLVLSVSLWLTLSLDPLADSVKTALGIGIGVVFYVLVFIWLDRTFVLTILGRFVRT